MSERTMWHPSIVLPNGMDEEWKHEGNSSRQRPSPLLLTRSIYLCGQQRSLSVNQGTWQKLRDLYFTVMADFVIRGSFSPILNIPKSFFLLTRRMAAARAIKWRQLTSTTTWELLLLLLPSYGVINVLLTAQLHSTCRVKAATFLNAPQSDLFTRETCD